MMKRKLMSNSWRMRTDAAMLAATAVAIASGERLRRLWRMPSTSMAMTLGSSTRMLRRRYTLRKVHRRFRKILPCRFSGKAGGASRMLNFSGMRVVVELVKEELLCSPGYV